MTGRYTSKMRDLMDQGLHYMVAELALAYITEKDAAAILNAHGVFVDDDGQVAIVENENRV